MISTQSLAVLISALGLSFGACAYEEGNGDIVAQHQELAAFSSVVSAGSVDLRVYIDQVENPAHNQRVTFICDSNLLQFVDIYTDGDVLRIDEDNWVNLSPSGRCEVEVHTNVLTELSTTGSGDVHSSGQADGLISIESTGSGDMLVTDLGAPILEVRTTGSGDLELAGEAGSLLLRSTGSGDIDASELISASSSAESTGSGDLMVQASASVHVRTTGSGDVDVWGQPAERDVESTGSGDVSFH